MERLGIQKAVITDEGDRVSVERFINGTENGNEITATQHTLRKIHSKIEDNHVRGMLKKAIPDLIDFLEYLVSDDDDDDDEDDDTTAEQKRTPEEAPTLRESE